MKFLILTYEDNIEAANETKRIFDETYPLPKHTTDIIIGYKVGDYDMKKNEVVMAGFRDKIVNVFNEPIYYMEDDVRFTKNPMMADGIGMSDIVWTVYRKGKITNKNNIITGAQAIYFSREAMYRLRISLQGRQLIHFDSYISKFIKEHDGLFFHQTVPKIGYENDHESLISKKEHFERYTKPN